jgi:hypothetical protein
MKTNKFIFILVYLAFFSSAYCQVMQPGFPLSFQDSLTDSLPIYGLENVENNYEIQRTDSLFNDSCSDCKNRYYGKGITTSINIKSMGQLESLSDLGQLWRLKIHSNSAYGMQFYFSDFNLPEGATLFFYSDDKSNVIGAFTSDNNPINNNLQFALGTQYIKGKDIIMEYYEPANASFSGTLEICNVIHIYKDIFDKNGPYGMSGFCNINVSCPLGQYWVQEISSVAIILVYNSSTGYSGWCSGALLNNTDEDGRPLFLTANHCIDDDGSHNPGFDYSNWVFLFNHQTPFCSSNGSDVQITTQSVNGAFLLSSDGHLSPTSDWALLELNTTPSVISSFNVCYAGWDIDESHGSNSASTVGIHHPSGDVKKISKDNDSPISIVPAGFPTTSPHWQVQWDQQDATTGITEPGSSGSPLFNDDHKVIGQLHGGSSECSNLLGYDYYGKFSEDWTNSGSTGLAFYLDPQNTHQTSINTFCPNGVAVVNPEWTGAASCDGYIGDGMVINGNPFGEACVSLPLVLTPMPVCQNTHWTAQLEQHVLTCSNVHDDYPNSTASKCKHETPDIWNCRCSWLKYFISIDELDENYNTLASYPKWFWHQYDLSNELTAITSTTLGAIEVTQSDMNELGVTLQPGHLYRITLAGPLGCWFCWDPAFRYFRYVDGEINKNNVTVDQDLIGKHINLTQVTVSNNITVTATKSIEIFPVSQLYRGLYHIDDFGCTPGGRFANNFAGPNTEEQYNNSFYNQKQLIIADEFTIIPNPNNGIFELNFKSDNYYGSDILIYDVFGEMIWSKHDIDNSIFNIDLSQKTKGLYMISFISKGKVYSQRVIIL